MAHLQIILSKHAMHVTTRNIQFMMFNKGPRSLVESAILDGRNRGIGAEIVL